MHYSLLVVTQFKVSLLVEVPNGVGHILIVQFPEAVFSQELAKFAAVHVTGSVVSFDPLECSIWLEISN